MKQGYRITRDKFLDSEERDTLMKACKDKASLDLIDGRKTWVTRYMVIHLALYSGLRVSEISKLKINDLHITNVKGPWLKVRNGKGGKERDVYLDKELVKHLKKYLDIKKKSWDESTELDAPLFIGQKEKHISSQALEHIFKQSLKQAQLPYDKNGYSIHSARHTYGTHLYHTTQNLRYVQKQLGHSSLVMTGLYADVLPEMNGELANKILG
ncbi:MAG: tyrosine-type recombinase/integrase [Planctomycetota bacterium]|jgi:site-specific recombinase XerD